MKVSNITSDHLVEGEKRHLFIIQHDLGQNWSLFTKDFLNHIFENLLNAREEQMWKRLLIQSLPKLSSEKTMYRTNLENHSNGISEKFDVVFILKQILRLYDHCPGLTVLLFSA